MKWFWKLFGWTCHEFGHNILWLRGVDLEDLTDSFLEPLRSAECEPDEKLYVILDVHDNDEEIL